MELDFTTCIGIDEEHAKELLVVLPSWIVNRPEIFLHPLRIFYDESMPNFLVEMVTDSLRHPDVKLVPVKANAEMSQRERMLSALTLLAPKIVTTEYLLKIDTDCIAASRGKGWCDESIMGGPLNAFVASPWGYTKPADAISILDAWGNKSPGIMNHPPLDLPGQPGGRAVGTPGRIISYVFFGRTSFLLGAAFMAGERLPLPSQDTYHWYVAKRMGVPFHTVQMKKFGWQHVSGRKLAQTMSNLNLAPDIKSQPYRESICLLLEEFADRCACGGRQATMAEIGVARGETSSYLLQQFPDLKMILIDPWMVHEKASEYHKSGDKEARMDAMQKEESFLTTTSNVGFAWDRVKMVRKQSLAAVHDIADGSLDVCFIDGDHTYQAVVDDLAAWWPKVKAGGYLAGHDFPHRRYKGVEQAVKEFTAADSRLILKLLPGTVFAIKKPS